MFQRIKNMQIIIFHKTFFYYPIFFILDIVLGIILLGIIVSTIGYFV